MSNCNECVLCRSTTGDNPRLYCSAGRKYNPGPAECSAFKRAFVTGFSIPNDKAETKA